MALRIMYGLVDIRGELLTVPVNGSKKTLWLSQGDANRQAERRGYESVKVFLVPETRLKDYSSDKKVDSILEVMVEALSHLSEDEKDQILEESKETLLELKSKGT